MLLAESTALGSSIGAVATLALFVTIGLVFLFVNLLVGRFVRPHNPDAHPEKGDIYECGEPTIGSSFVQFDLRFYVVALLFIIFDVEVAFFFPWATVFGKSEQLSEMAQVEQAVKGNELSADAKRLYREMGVRDTSIGAVSNMTIDDVYTSSKTLARITLIDIGVFFAVLILGFAYVWKRGDLDWVKAVTEQRRLARLPTDE